MSQAEATAYASSPQAFNGTICLACQHAEGADLKEYSKWFAAFWGF